MESVSLILIVMGAVIIGVVLLMRLGLRGRGIGKKAEASRDEADIPKVEPEFDPLFAIDEPQQVRENADGGVMSAGGIVASRDEAVDEPRFSTSIPEQSEIELKASASRKPPRVAEDPKQVVVLNVMARMDHDFAGNELHDALADTGFEYGEWQIFHYYSPTKNNAPPLFSLANMVKPGNFDLERMGSVHTPGLSLFMVPAGKEDDIAAFDTMLGTARKLADKLGGEVRDARRSVLTRQAIGHIHEQLNEWRCKAQATQH